VSKAKSFYIKPLKIFSHKDTIYLSTCKNVILTFTASSEPELITWILSFGSEAKILEPEWFIEEIKENITAMQSVYEEFSRFRP